MKSRHFALLATMLVTAGLVIAGCNRGPKPGDQSTPTLAYKALYEAVKKKDSEAIKKVLSKGTLEMMDSVAAMQKKTLNQVIENGLTETTFAPKLPPTRNEKITGEVAILEVKNEKSGTWESLPFAREEGNWKLAIDTYFRGTMSPNGPTNPANPGQLPPDAQQGTPQTRMPGRKPGLSESDATPGKPGALKDDAVQPAPTPGAKPGSSNIKRDIKPPTR